MSELSPKAFALVSAGRGALRPSAADRERITAGLRARLGGAVLPLEAVAATSLASRLAWAKLSMVGAVLGIAGGTTLFALHEPSPAPNAPVRDVFAAHAAHAAQAVQAPVERPFPAPNPAAAAAASAEPEPVPVSPRRSDRLAEEVSILSRATSDLHAGRPASALRAVEEHRRKFPNGLLAEERRAALVQALCALGRRDEAEPELARLARIAPQSANTLRAKQVCGAKH